MLYPLHPKNGRNSLTRYHLLPLSSPQVDFCFDGPRSFPVQSAIELLFTINNRIRGALPQQFYPPIYTHAQRWPFPQRVPILAFLQKTTLDGGGLRAYSRLYAMRFCFTFQSRGFQGISLHGTKRSVLVLFVNDFPIVYLISFRTWITTSRVANSIEG